MPSSYTYKTGSSNIIIADFPDPDVIRVDNVYYMISTTMHMFPGAVILRSYNLLNWEFCSYVFDKLDSTPAQTLSDNKGIYGKGMWAASLRFHKGLFYVAFVCNDTHKTYLYTAENVQGPWKKQEIPGFYHDMSILFDNGRAFIVSGNTEIRLVEMKEDLSDVLPGGINQVIIRDNPENVWLGYEGSHFYKIDGKYYIFCINIPKGKMRTETCFVSEKVEGPYTKCEEFCSDLGGWNSGCAQGGIVQSFDGKWFGILFQDHGALGRIPVLVPVTFENGTPKFQNPVPSTVTVPDSKPDHKYEPLFSNDFTSPAWQWNHTPDLSLVERNSSKLTIRTAKTVKNVTQAANTLSERTFTEHCKTTVFVDGSKFNDGDFAGACALEGVWAMIAVSKENGKFYLQTAERAEKNPKMNTFDTEIPAFGEKLPLETAQITLQLEYDLTYPKQSVKLNYKKSGEQSFTTLDEVELKYTLDHFMGVRSALFCYSTKVPGGSATFSNFVQIN